MKIAHRFNGGPAVLILIQVPIGTIEITLSEIACSFVPAGLDSWSVIIPSIKTLGYVLRARAGLTGISSLFENVIVDRVDGLQSLACDFRIRNADAESFFHAHDELERIDRVETKSIRTKQWEIVCDFLGCGLQHQIFYQHLFDAAAQIGIGHNGSAIVSQTARPVKRRGRLCDSSDRIPRINPILLILSSDGLGLIARRNGLIRIGPRLGGRRRRRILGKRLRGRSSFGFRLAALVQFVVEFVLCFLEFLHGLAHAACELGQFLRSEEHENNKQNDDQIRAGQIHEAGDEAHKWSKTSALHRKLQGNSWYRILSA
jgi:hypothetical protein